MTSYFFLVKKKSRAVGDLLDLSLDSFLLFPSPVAGCRGPCCAPRGLSPCFLLELLGGNARLRSLRNRARLWSKKVNLLSASLVMNVFQPLLFMARSLWLLKEKECTRAAWILAFLCSRRCFCSC